MREIFQFFDQFFFPFTINFNIWRSVVVPSSEVVDIDIEDNGDGTVNIYYTVADAGDYTLNIKFGGQPVPEGFYTFTVSPPFLIHFISTTISFATLSSPSFLSLGGSLKIYLTRDFISRVVRIENRLRSRVLSLECFEIYSATDI